MLNLLGLDLQTGLVLGGLGILTIVVVTLGLIKTSKNKQKAIEFLKEELGQGSLVAKGQFVSMGNSNQGNASQKVLSLVGNANPIHMIVGINEEKIHFLFLDEKAIGANFDKSIVLEKADVQTVSVDRAFQTARSLTITTTDGKYLKFHIQPMIEKNGLVTKEEQILNVLGILDKFNK